MSVSKLWSGLLVLSVACGSKFQANGDTAGTSGAVGEAGDSSSMTGGAAGAPAAGSSSGSAAGAVGHGGSTGTGHAGGANNGGSSGSMSGTGGRGVGGQVGAGGGVGGAGVAGSVGTGGTAGAAHGGSPNGGSAGSAGSDCSSLQSTYLADLEKARVCNPNAAKVECSPDSTLPGACQCPVLVAAGSAATAKAKLDLKAFEDAGCKAAACGIACVQYSSAVCTASGSTTTVCTGAP